MGNKMLTPPLMTSELARGAFDAALDIGSSNWDSYLEPCRWPELEADPRYIKFMEHISQFDKTFEEQVSDDAPQPDAPAADAMLDLHGRVANIIRKAYFTHTRNEQKAYETGLAVLEEVTRTYEQLAQRAGLSS